MAGNLVTIATFDLPAKARLAQNELEAAGIKATVADEQTVTMDWLLGNAIGWVKVQVLEEDAERAVAVLEESLGKDEPVDEETLAAEAEAAQVEEGGEPPERPEPRVLVASEAPAPAAAPDPEAEPPLTERDEYARRFFLAAVFGLVFVPLWFYAVYLFLNAAFGEGPLSDRGKNKLIGGGVVLAAGSFMAFIALVMFPSLIAFLF
jgi:hypothetical protein